MNGIGTENLVVYIFGDLKNIPTGRNNLLGASGSLNAPFHRFAMLM